MADVDLGLNVEHEYRYDVTGWLVAPSGTWAAILWEGTSAHNYDLRLNDAALVRNGKDKMDQDTGAPYYENERRPDQPLSAFSGEPATGEWQLILCDYFPDEDDGAYHRSQLILTADTLPQNTSGAWTYELLDVVGSDNVTRTVTISGLDSVGNRTTEPLSLTFQVDTVAPVITVTTAITEVLLGDTATVLSGTVSDGGQVNNVFVTVQAPSGNLNTEQVLQADTLVRSTLNAPMSGEWQYDLVGVQTGGYTVWVNVVDEAGNVATSDPFDLNVTCTAAELSATLATAVLAEPGNPISVTLTAVISNTGETIPAGLPAAFYVDGELVGTAATTRALDIGESEELSVTWDADFPGDYEINVLANVDADGDSPLALCSRPPEAQQTVTILDVRLAEDWNLMSSYVNPFTTDTSVVQRPIEGQYVVIQGFDGGAQSYYPDLPPEVNTLQEMDGEHGYWIKAVGSQPPLTDGDEEAEPAAVLRVVGSKLAEDHPIELDADWNLVSYLPRQAVTVTDALANIEGQYSAVLGYDQGALSYYPDIDPSFNTLHAMEPRHGYWIKMTQAGTLTYPTTGDQILGIGYSPIPNIQYPVPNIRQAERDAGVTATNTWVNFYGTARTPDGAPLPVGATVLALDPNGVVCGAVVVHTEGQYGLLACYGDDPTTSEDEGAQPGDTIQLVVDGQVLATGMWTAHGDRQWRPLGKVDLWQVYLPVIFKE